MKHFMHRTATTIWSTVTIKKKSIRCLLNVLYLKKKKKRTGEQMEI